MAVVAVGKSLILGSGNVAGSIELGSEAGDPAA
jgi:hypothetical protein